jgi:GNAT superfamily N-acetyltransferase
MTEATIRAMQPGDRDDVAELIYLSTNYWYQTHGRSTIFSGGPDVARVFFDVYEALDPGCGLVAVLPDSGRVIGSCFYHPRATHVSLGIMNTHPSYAGAGLARNLLRWIIGFAESKHLPIRLVSSAMNLDSFSLYTRAGFSPRCVYQDMVLAVPAGGLNLDTPGMSSVRPARLADVEAMAALESELVGIRRERDFRYFIENRDGWWHVSVFEAAGGGVDGFCASCGHPGCNMVGPGVARTAEVAAALLRTELDRHRGRTPVFLVPGDNRQLVSAAYGWGARNCEIHFSQVRGECPPIRGVTMPTFLPETA